MRKGAWRSFLFSCRIFFMPWSRNMPVSRILTTSSTHLIEAFKRSRRGPNGVCVCYWSTYYKAVREGRDLSQYPSSRPPPSHSSARYIHPSPALITTDIQHYSSSTRWLHQILHKRAGSDFSFEAFHKFLTTLEVDKFAAAFFCTDVPPRCCQ